MLFQVAARDSREKKILKTRELKQKRKLLQYRLDKTKYYFHLNKKLTIKKDKLLAKSITKNKSMYINNQLDNFSKSTLPTHLPKYYIK